MSIISDEHLYNYIKDYVRNNDCELISKNYINSKRKIEIKFKCGHIQTISFECFKRGQRCKCNQLERYKNTIENKTRNKIIKVFESINFKILSFENNIASWNNYVTYICKNGHTETRKIRDFMKNKRCTVCHKSYISESQKREKGNNWQGGKTKLKTSIKNKTYVAWKKESMMICNYKCVITGERFDDIHHLYPLHKIIEESLHNLNLPLLKTKGEYSPEEINSIEKEVERLHNIYPLGICLKKNIHQLFHKIYGNKNTTPENFYEFKNRYFSGEFNNI